MHEVNSYGEWPMESISLAAPVNEEGILKPVSRDETAQEMRYGKRPSIEIAVEWAHLGGD